MNIMKWEEFRNPISCGCFFKEFESIGKRFCSLKAGLHPKTIVKEGT